MFCVLFYRNIFQAVFFSSSRLNMLFWQKHKRSHCKLSLTTPAWMFSAGLQSGASAPSGVAVTQWRRGSCVISCENMAAHWQMSHYFVCWKQTGTNVWFITCPANQKKRRRLGRFSFTSFNILRGISLNLPISVQHIVCKQEMLKLAASSSRAALWAINDIV